MFTPGPLTRCPWSAMLPLTRAGNCEIPVKREVSGPRINQMRAGTTTDKTAAISESGRAGAPDAAPRDGQGGRPKLFFLAQVDS